MEKRWISSPQDRPCCRATDGQGRRCHRPVLWDEQTNRPLSSRCQAHGGLADAALVGGLSSEMKEMPDRIEPAIGTSGVLANSVKNLQAMDPGRPLRGLLSLALAGAFCLFLAAPALADFESALAAYNRGDYQAAETKFEVLAAAGDERAESYLERIRDGADDESESGGSVTSTLMDSVTSLFGGSESSSDEFGASTASSKPESATAQSDRGASSGQSADWKPWSPFDGNAKPAPLPTAPQSDVVVPPRESIWSTAFHLPGDATVVGLQYVAHFLGADNLSRELQILSRQSDKITLSILAGFWWLAIIKLLVGIGMTISRFTKVATTVEEKQRHA